MWVVTRPCRALSCGISCSKAYAFIANITRTIRWDDTVGTIGWLARTLICSTWKLYNLHVTFHAKCRLWVIQFPSTPLQPHIVVSTHPAATDTALSHANHIPASPTRASSPPHTSEVWTIHVRNTAEALMFGVPALRIRTMHLHTLRAGCINSVSIFRVLCVFVCVRYVASNTHKNPEA